MSKRIQNKHDTKKKPPKIEKVKEPKDREDFLTNMVIIAQNMQTALNNFFVKFRQYGYDLSKAMQGLIEIERDEKNE